MKRALLVILILARANVSSHAQMISLHNEDSLSSEQYAKEVTGMYERSLHLNPGQQQQTYEAILDKKKTLDSLRKNNIQVDKDKLWAINNSLDEMFRRILTTHQYADYLELQSHSFFTIKLPEKK